MTWKQRYQQVHEKWFKQQYPIVYSDGHYCLPKFPSTKTANGLTSFICNFLNWSGHRATRINVSGRLIEGTQKQASGTVLKVKKWLKSSTRKGSSDVSSTIYGKSYMWEVKIGADKASDFQLAEQIKERKAGGCYEFVSTPDQFLSYYDGIPSPK